MNQLIKMFIKKLKLDKGANDSHAGESEQLKYIAAEMGLFSGYIVDIAASDGYSQSPTLSFFQNGWSGFCVEMDSKKFSSLSYLYQNFVTVNLAKVRVTPLNIGKILDGYEVPKVFQILNLDIF